MPSDPHSKQRFYWGISYAKGYFQLGMLAEAKKELAALGELYQEDLEVLSLEGLILLARRRWARTITHCIKAVQKYPNVPDFYIQAAYAYDKLDLPHEAREVWVQAPEEVQTTPIYHYNIARCEIRLGNITQAREHLRTALDMAPEMEDSILKDPRFQNLFTLPEELSDNQ
tara:strand:- start:115122 stop:115634 length:513 start_codon:yes stop_codon:yes gene_type:complete